MKKIIVKTLASVLLVSTVCQCAVSCRSGNVSYITPPSTGVTSESAIPTVTPDKTDTIQNFTPIVPSTPKYEEDPAIRVSELMVLNNVVIKDSEGKYSPWIEIQNIGDKSVNLSEYKITISGNDEVSLPNVELGAGEYYVVFANGKNTDSSIGVTLPVKGEIMITHGDLITSCCSYANITPNYSVNVQNGSESQYPTPGYEGVREKDMIVISEIMSTNSMFPINGVDCDWVEIYNMGTVAVDLSNYYITKDIEKPYTCKLPDVVLEAGGYIVLACGKDIDFNLSKSGEGVYITRNDGVLAASAIFGEMEKNSSWTYDKGVSNTPSPGFENTEKGYFASICARKGLVISEVLSSNSKYSPYKGSYTDIVELYNNSNETINLKDYYLSDKGSDLKRYNLPDVKLAPGEYYVVYCDSEVDGIAPFGISGDGEDIYLTNEDGTLCDALAVPPLPKNVSWGRKGDSLLYFKTPSIGSKNGDGFTSMSEIPLANVSSGFYTESQNVTLNVKSGTIYYTTDGSKPTKYSRVYNGETIKVDKNMSIRAVTYDGDKIPSETVTYNYFINSPDYQHPVIKISVKDSDLFGSDGIYVNYQRDDEKEINLSFYENGVEQFSVDCGLKIFGAYSRTFTKKSFSVHFRSEYGTSRLEYPVFGDDGLQSFNKLVLRSGSQSLYTTDTMFTDEFITSLAMAGGQMDGVTVQDYRPCNLYINGEYYGVYFIREKINQDFIADHYNVSPESVTILNWPNDKEHGTSWQGWDQLWKDVYTNKLDLSNDQNYKKIADQLNLESFIDVLIMRMYTGDKDSAGNIRMFKSLEYDGGRWNFILFDNDLAFRSESRLKNIFNIFMNDSEQAKTHALLRALMKNDQFKKLFLSRLALHLNTTLKTENVHASINAIAKELEKDMPYQIDRWNDDSFYLPDMAKWRKNIDKLLSYTGENREKWFVLDVASTLNLSKDDVARYMGERFAVYIE